METAVKAKRGEKETNTAFISFKKYLQITWKTTALRWATGLLND
jgi:hypothetical protein